jgi:chromosome segregation ATPase
VAAALSAVVSGGVALWLGSSSTELRRLSEERARATSKAASLERSLSQAKRSLAELELKCETLEAEEEKRSFEPHASEQPERPVAPQRDLRQAVLRRLRSRWRRRGAG